MQPYKLGEMEQKFAELIWQKAPIASGELAKLCNRVFGWKRTTAYTMLKRLCDRGIFANQNGTVVIIQSKEEFQGAQGEQFINETFHGSLPEFLTAFVRRKKLTKTEIEELKKMIEDYEDYEE